MVAGEKGVRVVIISGLSGSGKSCVIKCFEDIGFFCIDNLPPELLPKFVSLCRLSRNGIPLAAIGIDIRERSFLHKFEQVYDSLIKEGHAVELLFLHARDEVLQRRFSETRRPHPLAKEGNVLQGISREREILGELRAGADRVIDTSDLSVHQLKEVVTRHYLQGDRPAHLNLSLTSFGFKYGMPIDLDLCFDVRFLKNPFLVDALRPLTGNSEEVQDYVLSQPAALTFLDKLYDMIDFLLPLYEKEGKSYLTIGIGCTGGRHRSVSIVNRIKSHLQEQGVAAHCQHRDVAVEKLS